MKVDRPIIIILKHDIFEILTGSKMPPSIIVKKCAAGARACNIILLVRRLYAVKIV